MIMARLGNYRIIRQIGEGGFARIFQAEHVLLNEKSCLKQNLDPSKEAVELLKTEAKILWKLNEHHSIPTSKDFIKIDRHNAVMVMDYIEGSTLEETVSDGRLHPEEACWISERLLGAVYYCYCNGVVHSDIKPENVFVEPKKRDIKLIDFGLAAYKPKRSTLPVGYTPRYAAPELTQGKTPIPETDLYGVGIVMLYALGGDVAKKSFPSDTHKDIVRFCEGLLRYDPLDRPNWDKTNLIKGLSDVRMSVFGRRHSSG
jgi:serine/threonine protein kinase